VVHWDGVLAGETAQKPVVAYSALEDLLTGGSNATAKSTGARLVIDRVASNSTFSVEFARRALYEEKQAELRAAMPAGREKLARLIDRRARARAAEMYEERMRLETEAVQAELDEATIPVNDGAAPDAPG
jgi:hypothetical protein